VDAETQARRFEQQLRAFEKLHAEELQALEARLAAYMRLHADEVKLLREQLDELRQVIRAATGQGSSAAAKPGSVPD
jgi:hypothetical protein